MLEGLHDLFGVKKPVIAMAHLPALPGTPKYDAAKGFEGLLKPVSADIEKLVAAGVDGILFCNEDDRPYALQADFAAVAAMTRVISELLPLPVPFGVDYLWDPFAPLAIAAATGASFLREVVSGLYESDMGLWAPDAAALYRYRRQLGAESVQIFANITPEFASPLGSRTVPERARSVLVSTQVDAILISGPMAGQGPDLSQVAATKEEVGPDVAVLVNTGAHRGVLGEIFTNGDGVIVGSSLKRDGVTWNPVEEARVHAFMAEARRLRADLAPGQA